MNNEDKFYKDIIENFFETIEKYKKSISKKEEIIKEEKEHIEYLKNKILNFASSIKDKKLSRKFKLKLNEMSSL